MKNTLTNAMNFAKSTGAGLSKISLKTQSPLPVYVVHTGANPDEYDFFFDMESYAKTSNGYFTRPKFIVYTGSADVSRAVFAQNFRESFEQTWNELARQKQRNDAKGDQREKDDKGWLEGMAVFDMAILTVVTGGAALVPILFLWSGLSAADRVISFAENLKNRFKSLVTFSAKKDGLSDIDAKRSEVDRALSDITLHMHPDLYVNFLGPGSPDLDLDQWATMASEWPLPDEVKQSLRWTSDDVPQKDRLEALQRSDQ